MKLVFDENFGRPIVEASKPIFSFFIPAPYVRHLFEFATPGTKDDVWLPKLAAEDWIVFSGDAGKKNDGAKLPLLCIRWQIRHVVIRGCLLRKRQFERMRAIIHLWPQLVEFSKMPRGKRMNLHLHNETPVLSEYQVNARKLARNGILWPPNPTPTPAAISQPAHPPPAVSASRTKAGI